MFTVNKSLEFDEVSKDVLEYGENPFVVITDNNQEIAIEKYCDIVFANNLTDNEEEFLEQIHDSRLNDRSIENIHDKLILGKNFLKEFLSKLPKPITIVQEMYHIDRCYRDTYYMYFSNQHFMVKRYSRRISFFFGEYDAESYFSEGKEIETD